MSIEGNPAERITDIDTFSAWLEEYKAGLSKNPDVKRGTRIVPPESGLDGQERIVIARYPWEEVPNSLQEVIAVGYDSAHAPGYKSINVVFKENELEFSLNAATVTRRGILISFDEYGEAYIMGGVVLKFRDRLWPEILKKRGAFFEGKWRIDRKSPVARDRGRAIVEKVLRKEELTDEEKEQHVQDLLDNVLGTPELTLLHLHETARLLIAATEYTELTRFITDLPQ